MKFQFDYQIMSKLLFSYLHKSLIQTRRFQEYVDTHILYNLLKFYNSSHKTYETFALSQPPWYKLPGPNKQWKISQSLMLEQVQKLVKLIHTLDSKIPKSQEMFFEKYGTHYSYETIHDKIADSYKTVFIRAKNPLLKNFLNSQLANRSQTRKQFQRNDSKNLEDLHKLQQLEQERLKLISQQVKSILGWCPIIKQSTIPNAGEGLFIDGKCRRGSVIGIYPGLIYTPAYIKELPNEISYLFPCGYPGAGVPHINGDLQNEFFFSTMYNHPIPEEVSIDEKLKWKYGKDQYLEAKYSHLLGLRFIHPFALCHKANHPRKGFIPNVETSVLTIPMNFDPQLLPYIPNKYYKPPLILFGTQQGFIKTVVFIANRDLEDEEVFVNYRYNPHVEKEPWYHHVDIEEDLRCWSKR